MKKVSFAVLLNMIIQVSIYGQHEFIDSTDYGKVMTKEFVSLTLNNDFSNVTEFENILQGKQTTYDEATQYYIPIVFHFIDSDQTGKRTFMDFATAQINLLNNNYNEGAKYSKSPFDEFFNDRKEVINNLTFFDFTPCANTFFNHDTYYSDPYGNFAELNFGNNLFDSVNAVLPMFDRFRAINVWVTDLNGTCDGFASMPFLPLDKQGIVIDINDFTGIRKYEEEPSRLNTFTHLIGNYLGLYSLWGLSYCADDYVDDTPIHNEPNSFESYFAHFSACPGSEEDIEMINNFMDSGNDDLKTMFTLGQTTRLKKLLSESGLLYTEQTICDSETVSLRNSGTELTINPTPTTGISTIILKNSRNYTNYITIHEATTGRTIFQTSFEGDKVFQIDINSYASGTYIVSLVQNGQIVLNKKIVKI